MRFGTTTQNALPNKLVLPRNFAFCILHLNQAQRDLHHVGKGILPLLHSGVFLGIEEIIADGADAKCLLFFPRVVSIQCGGLHFHAQHAHFCPLHVGACGI